MKKRHTKKVIVIKDLPDAPKGTELVRIDYHRDIAYNSSYNIPEFRRWAVAEFVDEYNNVNNEYAIFNERYYIEKHPDFFKIIYCECKCKCCYCRCCCH